MRPLHLPCSHANADSSPRFNAAVSRGTSVNANASETGSAAGVSGSACSTRNRNAVAGIESGGWFGTMLYAGRLDYLGHGFDGFVLQVAGFLHGLDFVFLQGFDHLPDHLVLRGGRLYHEHT